MKHSTKTAGTLLLAMLLSVNVMPVVTHAGTDSFKTYDSIPKTITPAEFVSSLQPVVSEKNSLQTVEAYHHFLASSASFQKKAASLSALSGRDDLQANARTAVDILMSDPGALTLGQKLYVNLLCQEIHSEDESFPEKLFDLTEEETRQAQAELAQMQQEAIEQDAADKEQAPADDSAAEDKTSETEKSEAQTGEDADTDKDAEDASADKETEKDADKDADKDLEDKDESEDAEDADKPEAPEEGDKEEETDPEGKDDADTPEDKEESETPEDKDEEESKPETPDSSDSETPEDTDTSEEEDKTDSEQEDKPADTPADKNESSDLAGPIVSPTINPSTGTTNNSILPSVNTPAANTTVSSPSYSLISVKSLSKTVNRKITIANLGTFNLLPDYSNSAAWKASKSPYNTPALWGQCTWFAWGRFYELYGFSPEFSGNGYQCVNQLVAAHPDKFVKSSTPAAGAVFSSDAAHNHVGIVLEYDEKTDTLTIQEGNLDGVSNPVWSVATNDYRTIKLTSSDIKRLYGNVTYAVPKKSLKVVDLAGTNSSKDSSKTNAKNVSSKEASALGKVKTLRTLGAEKLLQRFVKSSSSQKEDV